jgi:hypothetical protein
MGGSADNRRVTISGDEARASKAPRMPRTVGVALAVVLVWSLAPLYFVVAQAPDLLRGDIHGRRVTGTDWFDALNPLLLTAAFWLIAYRVYRRSHRARVGLIVSACLLTGLLLITQFADDFDPVFLFGSLVFVVPLLVAPFLPGVADWCDE